MTRLMILLLIVLVAGVIAIAALLQPGNSGNSYWLSVAWGVFLLILNWYSSAAIFSGSKADQEGTPGSLMGSLPGMSIGIFVYSLASITFLLLNRSDILGNTSHLVFQIVSAMVIIFIILLSSIAAKTQRVGAESSVSQRELLNSLKALRRSVEEDIDCSQIDEVINHVAYQMPHTSKLDGIELRKIFKVLSNISLDTSTRVMEANKLRHLS